MYESEADLVIISGTEVPKDIAARFAESRKTVTKRTLIPWSEHCTECVWPTCYTTCDLYSPRKDGKCRRFVEGMVRVDCPEALNSYLVKIRFKRWGKLWSLGNLKLHSLTEADRAERRDFRVAKSIRSVPLNGLRNLLAQKRYSLKKGWARKDPRDGAQPNCFLIECYNPGRTSISVTVTVRCDRSLMPFQALLVMEPGFNRNHISVAEIQRRIDLSSWFNIDLTPNDISDGFTLYFGAMDFVVDTAFQAVSVRPDPAVSRSKPRLCKCVVWDLDNTLWDGILIEDGLEGIRLRPGIAEILKQLDDRGILISAVSKNNHDDAIAALEHLGINEYFLFPQVSWNPKSEGIQQLAASLNIGVDSLLFVDDSSFERDQVKSVCPNVMVLNASEYQHILARPDCQAPVTEESRRRRHFYRDQQQREQIQNNYRGRYLDFLRECDLRLVIRPMTEANLERVHELTQRTNQMNFSGNRYSREQLQGILHNTYLDTYVIDCVDRFGTYGTIGFCLVNRSEVRMNDLMFSCRIQAKRVEHAFVSHLISKYRQGVPCDFFVNYRMSDKNAGPGKVFEDVGFQLLGEVDGVSQLVFPQAAAIPSDGVVTIEDLTPGRSNSSAVQYGRAQEVVTVVGHCGRHGKTHADRE